MSLHPQLCYNIPEETARVARAIFPDGNPVMQVRDECGILFEDREFAALFPTRGQPALSPSRLLLVTIFQAMEGLTDRQAAQAVRRCIDWKYALALELTDCGFDASVLSEFRARLLTTASGTSLFERLLTICKERGWLKARGKQRTDSTHVLAAIRTLNRLEAVGETMYHAIHSLLVVDAAWVRAHLPPHWFDRYAVRFEDFRLPQAAVQRQALATTIGGDGVELLARIDDPATPQLLRQLPAITTLRQVWQQQYHVTRRSIRWKAERELPAMAELIISPYDVDARRGAKRTTYWTGYKIHLTETCDAARPQLITDVRTTTATAADGDMTATIHSSLAARDLLPSEHFVDTAYVDAQELVRSRAEHAIDLVGPVLPDSSWQGRTAGALDVTCFQVDWEAQQAICPQGQRSVLWRPGRDSHGNEIITIWFDRPTCAACEVRERCTKAKTRPRTMQLRPRPQYEALRAARIEQTTDAFQQRYATRAGIEGTLSQGVRVLDLRCARYRGFPKVQLQHLLSAIALNLWRLVTWWAERPRAKTRHSRFAAYLESGAASALAAT